MLLLASPSGPTLLGDLLIAGDNRQCGGMNVSFSAVYRRVTE